MTCIECMMAETSPQLIKAAWGLSSATTLDQAQRVADPPSLWAGRIMELLHGAEHEMESAVSQAEARWIGEQE